MDELDIIHDPHHWSYKVPGALSWTIILLALIGAWVFPYPMLLITTGVALLLLLRFLLILGFYISGLIRCRGWKKWADSPWAKAAARAGRDHVTLPLDEIYHVILIANYKEPVDVLARTLNALAAQPEARQRLIAVLAMEAAEDGAQAKAQQLQTQFAGRFLDLLATFHPLGLPGEIRGKSSNLHWAATEVRRELVDRRGMALDRLTLTASDADSLLHPDYFGVLTRIFAEEPQRYLRLWQPPMLLDNNLWRVPALIRLFTFMANAVQLSEQTNTMAFPLAYSTFSLSYQLADQVGYWDPAVIADDTHMFMRSYFATRGAVKMAPVYLPTKGDTVTGANWRELLTNFYRQKLRHGWGIQDASYILQQWSCVTTMAPHKKLLPLLKVLHDHLIFTVGSILVAIGIILSVVAYGNPAVTIPPGFPFPLLQVMNGLGGLGLWGIWLIERSRAADDEPGHWRFSIVLQEIVIWAAMPIASFILVGVPLLHAHTKLMLGGQARVHAHAQKDRFARLKMSSRDRLAFVRPLHQRLHEADRVRHAEARVVAHQRDVISDHHAVEVHCPQCPHHLRHIHVSAVDEGLDEVRQRLIDVAKMHFEELVLAAEATDRLDHISPHQRAALQPAAHAQADADIRAGGHI